MHHYNFAVLANGETGRVGSPKRREIGHGALAERALLPVVPSQEEFAYTLRLVSDVLSSNGSTSMASVCGSSLSLMDAGVPIKAPVAGIAMGLVFADGKYTTLTDILGAEDAFGDMDFKVAGTADASPPSSSTRRSTASPPTCSARRCSAGQGRPLADPRGDERRDRRARDEVPPGAEDHTIQIPIDKIGEVIGPKGKVINTIQPETGADISVDDDGVVGIVTIGARRRGRRGGQGRRSSLILDPPTAELGEVYNGKVVNITKFGAFVNILPGRDGLVHISKLGRRQAHRRRRGRALPRATRSRSGRRHRPQGQGQPEPRR